MIRKTLLLPLSLVVATSMSPALAGGGNSALLAEAGAARYRLAAGPQPMLDGLDPASRATFRSALPETPGEDSVSPFPFWSQLFAGSLQVRSEEGGVGHSLWYNPVFDIGLVARWEKRGDRWVAVQAALAVGEMIRAEAGSASLVAAADGSELAQAYVSRAASTWSAAKGAGWHKLAAGHPLVTQLVRERATMAHAMLSGLRLDGELGQGFADVRKDLTLANPAERGIAGELREALENMGPQGRLSLRPVAALPVKAGWALILQSPDAPGAVWIAEIEPLAPGKAQPWPRYHVADIRDRSGDSK